MQQVANENQVQFWSHQLRDHMTFLKLGLVDPELKDTAEDLEARWNAFMRSEYIDPIGLNNLIEMTRAYQNTVYEAVMVPGNWVGFIFPSFVEHINDELNYFVRKLDPVPISGVDERKFWAKHHSGELGVTQQGIDPRDEKAIYGVASLRQEFEVYRRTVQDQETGQLLVLSQRYYNAQKQTEADVADGRLQTIIHPDIMTHVDREVALSILTLQRLGNS